MGKEDARTAVFATEHAVPWLTRPAADARGDAVMDKDVLALVIRVTEAPALSCWSCSMYEWMKLQGSWVHEMEMNVIDYEYSYSDSYSQPSLRFVLPLVLV